MDRKLYETTVKRKDVSPPSGNKVRFSTSTMLFLSKQMKENGATLNERMRFEQEFLKANGIEVPDSFFAEGERRKSYCYLDKFLKECTRKSSKNTLGKLLYESYVEWSKANKLPTLGKQDAFEYLYANNIMANSGTINGKTFRNVVIRLELSETCHKSHTHP